MEALAVRMVRLRARSGLGGERRLDRQPPDEDAKEGPGLGSEPSSSSPWEIALGDADPSDAPGGGRGGENAIRCGRDEQAEEAPRGRRQRSSITGS